MSVRNRQPTLRRVDDHEQASVERLLAVHDEQLAAVPKYRYLAAWDRLQRLVTGAAHSPIPVAEATA
jgi:hypothetical protein